MPLTRPTTPEEAEERLKSAFVLDDFGDVGGEVEDFPIPDKKSFLKTSATSAWAQGVIGSPVSPYQVGWQGQKDGIVRSYFNEKDASGVSDDDLFSKIAEDYKAKDALAEAARNAAARGESWLGKFREVEQTMPNVAGGRQSSYLGLAREVHDKFREKILPYQGIIRSVAEKARSIETSPEGMDWSGMAQELIQVPKESRPFVLEAISRQATANIDANAASRLGKEFARGFERFLDTAMSGSYNVLAAAGQYSEIPLAPETPQEIEARKARESQDADLMDLRDDIRDISTGKLAKLEDVRLLGMNISGAARNVPMTIGAFVPYIGPAALVGSFQRETANELRRANPTMSRETIEGIATISAPFQALTEVVSDRLLFGKLPNLKRLFTTPAFSAGGIAAQLAGRVALGTATEYAEEFAQGAVPKIVQSLSSDVPDVDWDGYFQDFKDQSPELLATIIPLALFGAGVGQATDYRASVQMLYSADEMMAAKIPAEEARKIAELATTGKRPEAESLFRQEFRKAATKGEAPAEMRAAAQRVIAANQAQKQTFDDSLGDPSKFGVNMYRDAEGWKVETYNGSVIKMESAEAAARYVHDLKLSFEEYQAETVIALADDLVQAFPGTRLELSPSQLSADKENGLVLYNPVTDQKTVLKDAKALENLWKEASAISFDSGNSPQYVLGQNFMEFGQSIARVFRDASGRVNSVPQAITAMHEVIEAAWKKGLDDGAWSVEGTRQIIATLVPTLEAGIAKLGKKAQAQELLWLENAKKAIAESNEDLVREVFVEMAVRTWIGRDRDGNKTGLRPGTILRAIDAAVLQEKSPENVTTYQRLRAWFKAVGAYLKGVVATAKIIRDAERNGTIDDFTGFLDKVLGIEAAAREESEVKQDVQNMAFSLAPELKDGSTFSLAPTERDLTEFEAKLEELQTLDLEEDQFNMPRFNSKKDSLVETLITGEAHLMVRGKDEISPYGAHELFIVDNDDAPIGFVRLTKSPEQISINMIHINEDYRGRGIGSEFYRYWLDKGVSVRSDKEITDSTAAVYMKLAKEGYAASVEDGRAVLRGKPVGSTFSLSPTSGIDIVSDTLESWQDVFDKAAKRNPTRAMAIRDLAQQRINRLGEMWAADRWTAKGDKIRAVVEKRTKGGLDDEQAMREALRYQELLDAGMMTLTPDVLMAWSEGVGTLEDDPLISKMLHDNGRLMSKSTAARQGLPIKDLYDDAVWLPPQFYSGGMTISTAIVTFKDGSMGSYDAAKVPAEVKADIEQGKATVKINKTRTPPTGGIMPDVMANNLGFDTASEMWAALESSIKSHRSAKEGYAKAEAAVKAVEKQAREQAKAEAAEWRQEADDMQADDWSPRESLVRDMRVLNVALSAFPPEVRAKVTGGSMVKLAGLATERARYKAIQKALEKAIVETEVFMRKEYTGMLIKTLDKAAPIGKPGEVKKSKFIVTVQDEIDAINDMVGMDHDDVATAIAAAEAAIITAQTPEDADAKLTELNLLELFGGILDTKNTSSQELASALEYLENIISQGRDARKMIDEARRERVKEMVNNAKREAYKGDSGPETTQAARAAAAKKSGKAMLKKFFNELSGFDAVLRDAFGPKSKTATEFSERFTLNSNRFEDVQNERRKRFRDFARELYRTKLGAKINQKLIILERIENASGVTYLKNRTVKTHKFTEEEAVRIVADPKAFGFTEKDAAAISEEIQAIQETGGRRKVFTYEQVENEGDRTEIPLSQMDALYLSMALRQPGILEQQQRYGYDQETVDQLEKFLTDDAKRWRSWMQMEYDAGYNSANEVYMRMFNTRMPKITFYAPLMKNHQGQQAVLDPLNTGISSNSANPGSIKTRKARTSSLRIESAFSVFWSHFNQMEYWNANAEYLRDVQSVMLNPEVREAVVSAHGEDGMATISAWVQLQMSRGIGKAALAIAGSKMFRNVKSAISMKALALNLSTTLKTIPSVFYSFGEIHMSKWPAALVSGMKHWDRLWKTNIIQRRLDIGGMPELRDLGSSALPMSWVNQGIRYGSYPTMYADGVFTTYSAAMAYGTSFDEAKRQGASDDMAHKYAEERTALIVSKTAQPENWTQKSLFENDASGAGSLFFMFTSDPRQKLALAGEALNQWRKGSATTEEAMRKFLAYWVLPGVMFQLANAIGRSVFKGDDDEWEVVDFATAALVGQFQGLALLGSAAEIIVAAAIAGAAEKITGEEVKKKPIWNSPKNPLDQAAQELVKSVGKITEDDVKDGPSKAWEITKSAGMLLAPLTPAGAIPSTAERVMKDTTNLFYGADEK